MQFVRRILGEQRKRVIASVMSAVESKVDLPPAAMKELRGQIMGAINQYHDTTLDILKSSVDDGSAVNEEAIRQVEEFNRRLREL